MYANATILAAFVLIYSAIVGRVERSWLSGPILFTGAGLLVGPLGAGVLHLDLRGAELRTLAELALAMVLFTDAAHADLGVLSQAIGLPQRLLLIGLPLTIILGFIAARLIFPALDPLEAALIASLLAPTDAALGAPVVTNKAVPAPLREALNLESGLNDGICVPVIVILLDAAIGSEVGHSTLRHILQVVVAEIGIGLALGLLASAVAVTLLRLAARLGWGSAHWRHIPIVALATLSFAAAQALGGSGFIACFAGGLLFGALGRGQGGRGQEGRGQADDVLGGATATGEVLALLNWVVFGGTVLARLLPQVTWSAALYATLSLTVVRIVPVMVSLTGTRLAAGERLFLGWFGPRGLASIVFAVIVFDADLPGKQTMAVVAACTILFSLVAHGATANPFILMLGRREQTKSDV